MTQLHEKAKKAGTWIAVGTILATATIIMGTPKKAQTKTAPQKPKGTLKNRLF